MLTKFTTYVTVNFFKQINHTNITRLNYQPQYLHHLGHFTLTPLPDYPNRTKTHHIYGYSNEEISFTYT